MGDEGSTAKSATATITELPASDKPDTPGTETNPIKVEDLDETSSTISTESVTSITASTALLSINSPHHSTSPSPADTPLDTPLDTRHPHRHGWPLLPSLPVCTSNTNIPKTLSATSPHLTAFRAILASHSITPHSLTIAHRFHKGTPTTKQTLTLLIQSSTSDKPSWPPALLSLRKYLTTQSLLPLRLEILDHRIVNGMFTLPILSTDPLAAFVEKKKHGIAKLLNESGEQWTSLEFYYRGVGGTRAVCRPVVLIGVPEPEKGIWWEGGDNLVGRVGEKVRGRMGVEVVWRVGVRF
ncbi:hypothetical protein NX059_008449 [Plenodomus lindquistii]|nr:hypothetical protein NX059_008449 [Plenodomus lindquistii]